MNNPLFSVEELAAARTAAAELQTEVDDWVRWLDSPEGRAWGDQVLQECRTMAEEFKQDCAAGKFGLSDDELEQLRREGMLVKCHTIKSGGVASD